MPSIWSIIPRVSTSIIFFFTFYIQTPFHLLKRFFLIHFQFPFLLCGFRILHLYYLHFLSSTNPLRNSTNNKIPFFPFLLLRLVPPFYSFGSSLHNYSLPAVIYSIKVIVRIQMKSPAVSLDECYPSLPTDGFSNSFWDLFFLTYR